MFSIIDFVFSVACVYKICFLCSFKDVSQLLFGMCAQVALVGLIETLAYIVRRIWQEIDPLPRTFDSALKNNVSKSNRKSPLKRSESLLSAIEELCASAGGQISSVRKLLRNLCSKIRKIPALTWPTVMALCCKTCQYDSSIFTQLAEARGDLQSIDTGEGNGFVSFYDPRSSYATSMVAHKLGLKTTNLKTRILQLLTEGDDVWALYSDGSLRCWRDISIHRQRDDQDSATAGDLSQWPDELGSEAMHDAWARANRRVRITVNCFNGYPSYAISTILYAPGYHDRGAWLSLASTNIGSGGNMIAVNTTIFDDRLWLYSCTTGKLVHCVRLHLPQLTSSRDRTRVQTSKKTRVVGMHFVCSSGLVVCALAGPDRVATALGVPQIVLFDIQTGRIQSQLQVQV